MTPRIKDNIDKENQIGYAMLNELISNKKLQILVQDISDIILTNILKPLQDAVSDENFNLNDSKPFVQASIKMLSLQNTDSEIPFGGILNGFKTADEIFHSQKNIQLLFDMSQKTLLNVSNIKNFTDVLKLLKSIADLTFCYFEYFDDIQSTRFKKIKDFIWLTPEECDGRILQTELGLEPRLAVTLGIRKSDKDFVPFESKIGIPSGKALFKSASMKDRLAIIMKQYDNAFAEQDEKKLLAAVKKMQTYHIPLVESERATLEEYAKRYKTTFKKLAKGLPLVANISRSLARTLICLQDLYAFGKEKFDLDLAQQFSNCAMIFYVCSGHHSITELAEVYNRLLDYIAIVCREQLSPDIFDHHDQAEKRLPYYRIGDYGSFIHRDYREKIMESDQELDLAVARCSRK